MHAVSENKKKMCSTMMIEESQVLQILRDHLEESGLIKCMRDFEKHTRTGPADLPRELLCLRGLALDGQWEAFMAILQSLLDEAWVPRCRYEVLKQQFLENLASYGTDPATTALHVCSNSKEVMDRAVEQLRELKKLCPCKEEYMTLCHLLSNPSLLTSPHWDLYHARLDCFQLVSSFFTSEKSPTTSQAAGNSSNKCSCLTRLLVKGWLYEKCERVCAQRCRDCEQGLGAVMDLHSWMLRQPDTAFLVAPDAMRLVLARSEFGGGRGSIAGTKKERVDNAKCIDDGIEAKPSEPKIHVPDTTQKQHIDTRPNSAASMKDSTKKQRVPEAQQSASNSSLTLHHSPSSPMVQEFGGCSSTPVPSTPPRHTPSSPVSSPVPYIRGTHGLHDTPLHSSAQLQSKRREARSRSGLRTKQLVPAAEQEQEGCSSVPEPVVPPGSASERRHINFAATDSDYVEDTCSTAHGTTDSVSWPSCALLTTVTDPQVIRSVAFSDSGGAVAIGANSKTLRIFHTEALMQQQPIGVNDLCLLYHHPRYHKGSIYCLAWYGDTILASGSNDQTIKLLSHSPESDTPYSVAGRLDAHAGTVRDMDFMRDGLLVSGGAGSLDLKICDIASMQLLQSCEGHTDQILGVSAVSERVVASGSQDQSVRLWDIRQGGQPAQVLWAQAPVSSVSSSAPYIAAALLNGCCCVWDSRNMSVKYTLKPHSDECRSVCYSPTGEWILSGSYDGKVCLVSSQGPFWREVCGHRDKVIQCRWHSAGHVFATTGADKRACFWRLIHNN